MEDWDDWPGNGPDEERIVGINWSRVFWWGLIVFVGLFSWGVIILAALLCGAGKVMGL